MDTRAKTNFPLLALGEGHIYHRVKHPFDAKASLSFSIYFTFVRGLVSMSETTIVVKTNQFFRSVPITSPNRESNSRHLFS